MAVVGTKLQTGIADSEPNADSVDNTPAAFTKVTRRESTNGLEVPQDCSFPRFLVTQDFG